MFTPADIGEAWCAPSGADDWDTDTGALMRERRKRDPDGSVLVPVEG